MASVVTVEPPLKSAVRQMVVDGQSSMLTEALEGPADELQVGAEAKGFVVRYLFAPADATHSVVDGQDTASTNKNPAILSTVQVGDGPIAFVVVMTSPAESLATHSVVDGQEMELKLFEPSAVAVFHVGEDAVRSVTVVNSSEGEAAVTPTHSVVEGQSIHSK
ncbi:MAG: hypothetical protein M1115_11960 [Actinobacteria bacterium]|nr:hypothetical protein [Actinomycetota bacterium]